MKRKCAFSVAIVIALAALSVAAFTSSLAGMPADKILEQRTMPEAVTAIELEAITGSEQTVMETALTEKPIEAPYRSVVASLDWNARESYLLAKLAMAEAESEDTEGKSLVVLVVLNRVLDDKEFPDTIEEVIYQPGQFSSVSNGRFDRVEPDEDCWKAVYMVWEERWDESRNATYFCTPEVDGKWHDNNLTYLFQYGNHKFYKDIYNE